jgi:hypothetical protein
MAVRPNHTQDLDETAVALAKTLPPKRSSHFQASPDLTNRDPSHDADHQGPPLRAPLVGRGQLLAGDTAGDTAGKAVNE